MKLFSMLATHPCSLMLRCGCSRWRWRWGVTDHQKNPLNNRTCQPCSDGSIGDEVHFVRVHWPTDPYRNLEYTYSKQPPRYIAPPALMKDCPSRICYGQDKLSCPPGCFFSLGGAATTWKEKKKMGIGRGLWVPLWRFLLSWDRRGKNKRNVSWQATIATFVGSDWAH